jgi:hypothetical protein
VIRHDVEDDPEAQFVGFGDQLLRLLQRAERWLDGAVVGHVVAGVGHR